MSVEHEIFSIENHIIAAAQPTDAPVFVHMLGIPGSGKSSFFKILQNEWIKSAASKASLLGFDQIMQLIPSYQKMNDKIAAFATYEIPARLAGYRILEGLLLKRSHILFDNGGSAESHPDLLRHARDELGYRLVFVWMNTPIEIARGRVDFRAVEEGQHTPLHYLEERAMKLEKLMKIYRTLTPHFYEIDNSSAGHAQFIEHAEQLSSKIVTELGF